MSNASTALDYRRRGSKSTRGSCAAARQPSLLADEANVHEADYAADVDADVLVVVDDVVLEHRRGAVGDIHLAGAVVVVVVVVVAVFVVVVVVRGVSGV